MTNYSLNVWKQRCTVRDVNGIIDFETDEGTESAKVFAHNILSTLKNVPIV